MKPIRYFIVICLSLLFHISYSETRNYQIKLAGFKIGTLQASHYKMNNVDYYSIISDVSVNLLVKVKVYYKTVSIYKNNMLMESIVNSLINGKQYYSTTKWNGSRYMIDCNSHKYKYSDTTRSKPIHFSVSKLYFEKPTHQNEIYAENYGLASLIQSQKNNQFLFEIPNSKQIYYYSTINELDRVEIINSIKNFEVVKTSQ